MYDVTLCIAHAYNVHCLINMLSLHLYMMMICIFACLFRLNMLCVFDFFLVFLSEKLKN